MLTALEVWLPTANAALIGVSGVCVLLGVAFIRRKQVARHHRSMITATVFAALFLLVYVTRALLFEEKTFSGEGPIRVAYLAILGSHVVLAIAVAPLVLVTLRRAVRRDFRRHRRLARVTVPIWLYVVASGWAVYLMLYAR